VSNTGLENVLKSKDKETTSKLFLTNELGFESSNSYFLEYRIINQSTNVSINHGYSTKINYYDIIKFDYCDFNIDSITDSQKSKIKLKGRKGDNSFKNANINYVYSGKIDTDNTHSNWLYAKTHNDRNLLDLEKIGLEITMKLPNFNLYKFQKITVLISNNSETPNQNYFNERLSGEWLITDIKYRFEEFKMKQVIILVKRELELSDQELKNFG
jgi:hypothetical protein